MRLLSRQSWNPLALLATARTLVKRPGLLVPHVAVRNVDELNYDALRAAGVASIIFDKDNTLTAPYVDSLCAVSCYGCKAHQDSSSSHQCFDKPSGEPHCLYTS